MYYTLCACFTIFICSSDIISIIIMTQLVSARTSVRKVSSSIPGDITSLFQLPSFPCSFH